MLEEPLFWAAASLGLILLALVLKLLFEARRPAPPDCPACGAPGVLIGKWSRDENQYRCDRCGRWWVGDKAGEGL